MYSTLAKFAALFTFTLLLSPAYAGQHVTTQVPPASWQEITEMQLLFKGEDSVKWPNPLEANQALFRKDKLRKTLDLYGVPDPGNLGAYIAAIRRANGRAGGEVPGMTGLGGVHGRAFLDVADRALLPNGKFDDSHQVVVAVSGQITKYHFDKSQGTGDLVVITYITSIRTPQHDNPGNNTPQTDAYRWTIHVDNALSGGFTVVHRVDTDPNLFPNTMKFTSEMVARIKALRFTRKLWVKGKDIKINKIERKAGNSSTWVPLNRMAPQNRRLYEEIDDNCIDMMFVGEPPEDLTAGMKPPFYCLGRCENPLIVNTGE